MSFSNHFCFSPITYLQEGKEVKIEAKESGWTISDSDIDTEKEIEIEPLVSPKEGAEVNPNNSVEQQGKTKPAENGQKLLPFMDKESLVKMIREDSNKEEASYAKLYEDIKAFYKTIKGSESALNEYLLVREQRQLQEEMKTQHTLAEDKRGHKIGRNDPCSCGSGKKYKLCHGRT